MAIGTISDLTKAANGIFKPRVIPTPTPSDPQQEMYNARSERAKLAQSAAERISSTIQGLAPTGNYSGFYGAAVSPTSGSEISPTYSNILSQYGRSPYGLTNKGKYGGFYSAADQEAAIRGSAQSIIDQAVPTLRSAAEQRYSDIDKAYAVALGNASTKYLQANPVPNASSAANFRMIEEIQGGRVPGLKPYTQRLGSWYQQNAAPAADLLTAAQQFETTPVSDLAQQIAVSSYGMNPDLARGKFGVDLSNDQAVKDYNFKRLYGMTEQEINAEMKKQTELYGPKAQDTMHTQALEQLTGIPAAQLQSASGRSLADMYSAVTSTAQIPFEGKDENGNDISGNYDPSAILQNFMFYVNKGDWKRAGKWIDAVSKTGQHRSLADLLYGISQNMGKKRTAARETLTSSQQSQG